MSKESANQFLTDAAQSTDLREKFNEVSNSKEFLQVAEALGYNFTTDELKAVLQEYSEGVTLRRPTGLWKWLRSVNWVERIPAGSE